MFVQGKHEFYVFAKNKDDKVDPALCKKNAILYYNQKKYFVQGKHEFYVFAKNKEGRQSRSCIM